MKWMELTVKTTSEAVEPISNILMEHGASGVAIEDALDYQNHQLDAFGEVLDLKTITHLEEGALISAYYPETIFLPEILPDLKARINGLTAFGFAIGSGKIVLKEVEESNWADAWKKYYHPVRVTRFITVVPSWETYASADDELVIRLDPGMAFGTGTHPTTMLSLQALEIYLRGGETLLDVGTGSGVLSIAAKLLGASAITAFDLDQVAVTQAQLNLDLNPLAQDVQVAANNLLNGITQQVDVVVANILAEIILPLIPQAWSNLKEGGYFITSGIIHDKVDLIKKAQQEAGFEIISVLQMKDWYALVAQKPLSEESGV